MKSLFLALAAMFLPAFLHAASPTIGTSAATVLTGTTARITGTVTGGGVDVTVTVNYGTTTTYGSTVNVVLTAAGTDAAFTVNLSGLAQAKTYHFEVVASNGTDPATKTADATFTIPAFPPAFTEVPPTTGDGTVHIEGLVTANGAATTMKIKYGVAVPYTETFQLTGTVDPAAVDLRYFFDLSSLKHATTYHYQIIANNGVSPETVTPDRTFFIPAVKPGLTAPTVNVVSSTSAIISATVTAKGADTTVWVDYGTAEDLTGATRVQAPPPVPGEGSKLVDFELAGILANTDYHYQVSAMNSAGTTKSAILTFRSPQKPEITVSVVPSVTSATIKVLVTAHGAITEVKLEYGLNTTYGTTDSKNGIPQDSVKAIKEFELINLARNTEYNYRLTAKNSAGDTVTANTKFKTAANSPPVANADTAQLKGGRSITVDVLDNDTEADGDKLTLEEVSEPKNGTAKIVGTKVVYTPSNSFRGTDDFTYEISDGAGGKDTGTVTIRALQAVVVGVNSAVIKDAEGNEAGAYKIIGNANGAFTARINIGEESSVVTGKLDANGNFSATLPNGTMVDFSVKQDGDKNTIVAEFERADGKYTAETPANELTTNRRNELAGLYTITIPAPGATGTTANGLPQGAGSMTLTAKAWGGVSVRGILGDGSKFSYGSTLTGTNAASAIPLWLSPKNARVTGTVTLTGTDDITANAPLRWYRPPGKNGSKFPEGFYIPVTAAGAAYTAPEKKFNVLKSEAPAATIAFQGGDLASNLTTNIEINTKGKVQLPKGGVRQLTVYPKKGTFTGTFEHPIDGDNRKFQGVFTKDGIGTGVFTGNNQTGTVKIIAGATVAPAPQPQPQPNPNGNPGNPQIDFGN